MPKRRNFSSERFRLFLCIPRAPAAHPNHRERGRGDVWQTGIGGVCRLAAGICGGAVPVVSAGAAPEDADSWLSQFKASGAFDSIDCQIAGLGEIEDVQKLYVAHTKAAIDSLNG